MRHRPFDDIWYRRLEPADPAGAAEQFEEFQLRLFRSARRANPDDECALSVLAHQLTRIGEHREALEMDRRLVQMRDDNPVYRYNLACSYSNLGQVDRALSELSEALELGHIEIEQIENDPDLEEVRKDPRYEKLLKKYFGDRENHPGLV